MEHFSFDFLVLGSGIAGLSAAKVLCTHGNVAIITKSHIKESATQYAQGGIAAALQPDDTVALHSADTLAAGDGLCDPDAVRILVEEGPARVKELIELGVRFNRGTDGFDFTKEAAHSRRRILHAEDATGREIEKTLGLSLLHNPKCHFFPNTVVSKLLVQNNRIEGCLAIHRGVVQGFFATRAVILATGGAGQVYAHHTNPQVATGDGVALAYRAGCAVQDMEFFQFHPTTLYQSNSQVASSFLISEAVRGEGAILRNHAGEAFMKRYHPMAELAPRDVVARSIFFECQKTATSHVWLDLTGIPLDLKKRFPTIYQKCEDVGILIDQAYIPVAPAAHYFMGGVRTDSWGQTDIEALYAVGEVASVGIHGANRLASNSLLDGLVFGNRAARHALTQPSISISQFNYSPSDVKEGVADFAEIKTTIQACMWQHVGIVRSQEGLRQALDTLHDLQFVLHLTDPNALEVQNLWEVAHLITQAALFRTESRGSHFRSDYPNRKDDLWQVRLVKRIHQTTWQTYEIASREGELGTTLGNEMVSTPSA